MTVRPFILSAAAAAAGAGVTPDLTLAYDDPTDTLTITSNAAGVVFWSITTSGTSTSSAVISGSGVLNGSVNTAPGTASAIIDTTSLNPANDYWIHAVLTNGTSAISTLKSVQMQTAEVVVWYEADALFAWSPITDTDTAAINPAIGGTVPLVTGTGAVAAAGLWDMDTNRYVSSTGMTATSALTKPALFACVLNPDNQADSYGSIACVGAAVYMSVSMNAGTVQMDFTKTGGTSAVALGTRAALAGTKVLWCYWDGTSSFVGGVNQTTSGTVSTTVTDPTLSRDIRVGNRADPAVSKFKHGAMQVVARTGMTLTDAKAIIAKMQTHHGI